MSLVFYIKQKTEVKKNFCPGPSEPYTASKILSLLLKNKVNAQTLLYSPQDKKWTALSKRTEFQMFFPKKNDEQWMLLKKVNNEFLQSGPYSKKGIQKLLVEGCACDQDFAWKEGWTNWRRLSICKDFHTRLDFTIEDAMDELALRYKDQGLTDKKAYLLKRSAAGLSWKK